MILAVAKLRDRAQERIAELRAERCGLLARYDNGALSPAA
jgi:hypothetical protein